MFRHNIGAVHTITLAKPVSCKGSPSLRAAQEIQRGPGCSMGYPPETHLKLKSHENSFIHKTRFSSTIALKIDTKHRSMTVVRYAYFKTIGHLRNKLGTNGILRELSLSLNARGPNYSGSTLSISWLLMPWLLASPGHQQPWYWLCIVRICKFLSYTRKDFSYMSHVSVDGMI